ncbi:S-layer homology domain-containing protein [Cohnella lubricantis]|uniref:S-layer homology domain-containing protein n=1 Tax=Cohnella lubricantis TaxID=2163172 RepID=A0A841T7K5_9BACL|nr:S-layer homology domain-containing protein [Cohnella lubricantis]MBB6676079.1 S-layer homology domain-containing protein [Cohnella lubricantis]MBP2118034.1 hypothetical protein [Cohnella lubricantis]
MAGYSDGTFKPDRPLSRAELASALARAVQREEIGSAPAFTDVEAGHWASSAIAKAYRMRLMAGEPGGAFEPNRAVTFRELTIVFGRLLGSETEALSIMNGRSASIHDEQVPQDAHGVHDEHIAVSRAEFVVWMNAMLRRRPLTDAPQQWIDVSADREEYEDIQEASISHLFEPTPDGSETWGESARRKDD